MKNFSLLILFTFSLQLFINCVYQDVEEQNVDEPEKVEILSDNPSKDPPTNPNPPNNPPSNTQPTYKTKKDIRYLALGDSYTIGESVATEKSFPAQLKERIETSADKNVNLKIIARTGWRTDDLISAIENEKPSADYDLVSLLIGVNNQFQGRDFKQYESEFNDLLNIAIKLAQGHKKNVFVVSIPDYAFTPFGGGSEKISEEIDKYNDYARRETVGRNIPFIEITEITRRGLQKTNLVASDGLHPSADAYAEFVTEIYKVLFP